MKIIKKADIIYLSALSLAVIMISIVAFFTLKVETSRVVIENDGEIFGSYDLSENQIIDINSENFVEISNNSVKMIDATCADKLCINQGSITTNLQTIVCLPNEVIVYLEGDVQASDIDAVSK